MENRYSVSVKLEPVDNQTSTLNLEVAKFIVHATEKNKVEFQIDWVNRTIRQLGEVYDEGTLPSGMPKTVQNILVNIQG